MVKTYDDMYSALMEIEEAQAMTNCQSIANENEELLLKKISELEMGKDLMSSKLSAMTKKNEELLSRVESLNEFKNEFETKTDQITKKEKSEINNLKYDLRLSQQKVNDLTKEIEKLESENKSAYLSLHKLEMEQSQIESETMEEMEKSNIRNSNLERQLTRNQASHQKLASSLKEREFEIDELKQKMLECNKKYNMLRQLNKSTSTNARSLENENSSLLKLLENENKKYTKLYQAFESVAIELHSDFTNDEKIKETISNFFVIKELKAQCIKDLNIFSEMDEDAEIEASLEELESEFENKSFDEKEIQEMEEEIEEYNNDMLGKMVHESSTMNNSKEDNRFSSLGSSTEKIRGISQMFDLKSSSRRCESPKLDKLGLKNEISKKLEMKIQTLSKKKQEKLSIQSDNCFFPVSEFTEKNFESQMSMNLENSKSIIFSEFERQENEILSQMELEELKGAWNKVDSLSEFTVEVVKFFKKKLIEIDSKFNACSSEKKLLENVISKKTQEMNHLHKIFIQRNKEYEAMLNETVKVNTQLYKNQQKKMKKIKEKTKKITSTKRSESPGLFDFIKKSFLTSKSTKTKPKKKTSNPKMLEKSVKSGASKPSSFVISQNFAEANKHSKNARENLPFKNSGKSNQVRDSLNRNLKFKEDMKHIEANLGPAPIFEFESEISSLRNILNKSRKPRKSEIQKLLGKSKNSCNLIERDLVTSIDKICSSNVADGSSLGELLKKKKRESRKLKTKKYFVKKFDKLFN